jgi:hypothetical protein
MSQNFSHSHTERLEVMNYVTRLTKLTEFVYDLGDTSIITLVNYGLNIGMETHDYILFIICEMF